MTIAQLAAYLLTAMTTWVPMKEHASFDKSEQVTATRYASIANDIATVALDEKEAPAFTGPEGRIKTALLITSITSLESSFSARVIDGTVLGDHGTAFCGMQIRPALGIVLDDFGYDYVVHKPKGWKEENLDKIVRGPDLIKDPQLCYRTGLHMIRDSFRAVHHLGIYTGEGSTEGPKAKHRLERAKQWLKAHPFEESTT